jgi:hypothetical protein
MLQDRDGSRVMSLDVYQNLAAGAPATSGGTLNNADVTTNGDTWADSWNTADREFAYTTQTGSQYVQIDLGTVYTVTAVNVWHYATDERVYRGTKTEVSSDGVNWTAVFSGTQATYYPETAAGRSYSVPTNDRQVRYVRDWLHGSSANAGNHWVEIEAGARPQSPPSAAISHGRVPANRNNTLKIYVHFVLIRLLDSPLHLCYIDHTSHFTNRIALSVPQSVG